MSHTRSLLTSGFIYTIGDFLVVGVSSFLFIPVYVRHMSSAEYGIYGTLTTMIGVFGAITQLGLLSALSRYYYVHQADGVQAEYMGAIIVTQGAFVAVVTLFCWAFGGWGWHALMPAIPYVRYVAVVMVASCTVFASSLYPMWLRIHNRARSFVVVQLINTVVGCLLVVAFVVIYRGEAFGALLASAVTNVLMCLLSLICLWKHIRFRWRPNLLQGTLSFGMWTALGTVGYLLLNRSQMFLLQRRLSLSDIGKFYLALQLASAITLLSTSFAKALQPTLYAMTTVPDAINTLQRFVRPYLVILLYAGVGLIIFAADILAMLTKNRDPMTASVLRIITLGAILYAVSAIPTSALFYMRRVVAVQILTLAALVLNVVVSITVAHTYGVIGAAWSYVAGFVVLICCSVWYAQRFLPVNYEIGLMMRGLICGAVACGGSLMIPSTGLAGMGGRVGIMILFTGLLLLVGVIRRSDVTGITRMISPQPSTVPLSP